MKYSLCTCAALSEAGIGVHTTTLDEPEHGFTKADSTDVLIWWAHMTREGVSDKVVEKYTDARWLAMGLIVLHSAHVSKLFKGLMAASCELEWRPHDHERRWVVEPGHPIVECLRECVELKEKMCGEPFDVPLPDEFILVGWFGGRGFLGAASVTGEDSARSSTFVWPRDGTRLLQPRRAALCVAMTFAGPRSPPSPAPVYDDVAFLKHTGVEYKIARRKFKLGRAGVESTA